MPTPGQILYHIIGSPELFEVFMQVNVNSQLAGVLPEALAQIQRAFLYGDALFETIRVFDGKIPLLDRHWSRLSDGLSALGFEQPPDWDASFFRQEILKICPPNGRARLTVWRSPGGFYAPENNTPQFMITAQHLGFNNHEWMEKGVTLGLSESVRLPVDAYSAFKSLNCARYVAASMEAQKRKWDDVLILNMYERVCEATASNVFWWEEDRICTIPLTEGCVAGVQRALLLETAPASGFAIQEKPATFATLQNAGEIFLTNAVRGIIPVCFFAGCDMEVSKTKQFFDAVFRPVYTRLLNL